MLTIHVGCFYRTDHRYDTQNPSNSLGILWGIVHNLALQGIKCKVIPIYSLDPVLFGYHLYIEVSI